MFRTLLRDAAGVVLFAAVMAAFPPPAAAQSETTLRGAIRAPGGAAVAGARVEVEGRDTVVSDADGRFTLRLPAGDHRLRVSHPGYRTLERDVTVSASGLDVELRLQWVATVQEAVTVEGIRAGDQTPVTKSNLDGQEIDALAYGQDVPQLLQYTPSMTWYSDSGTGANYSYFSLRGIHQTRINMTFDGAPLNDPAEHALYFNNFHDFTSAVDSIQVQRGVGTSSVGSPAYGGSVNFASPGPRASPRGDARVVLGSYDTARASLAYDSGLIGDGFWASGRFSYARTDGYRESSGTEHDTFFWNAGWQGERAMVKLVGFSGRERSQLAYLAVEPEILAQDRRFNPLSEQDRDEFGQDFVQLKYSQPIGDASLLTASAYYNGADGFFQLWDDPVAQTDLLRFGIDQGFVGSMVTFTSGTDNLSTTLGIHFNDFAGDHFLDSDGFGRLYANTGFKQTANGFGKIEYRAGDTILFGDAQLRWAKFSYEGNIDLGSVDWTFFDPKVGVRQLLSERFSVYGSVGRAQREPARLDLLLGEDDATVAHDLTAVRPESVVDVEAGVNYNSARLALAANLYAMEFRDEIALTGELSDVGLPLRRNVERSYRRGFELDLRWLVRPRWSVLHSINLNRSRIGEWTQFYDVYDAAGASIGSTPISYLDVPHLLTPAVTANYGIAYTGASTEVAVIGRSVSHSQLDNTGLEAFRTPAFTVLNVRASQDLGRWWPGAMPRLRVFVNNLLNNEDAYPSGYSYQFLLRDAGADALAGSPYFYPLATFNAVVMLEVGF